MGLQGSRIGTGLYLNASIGGVVCGRHQEVEDAIAIFLDEQFETVAEDGSLEEVRACRRRALALPGLGLTERGGCGEWGCRWARSS